MTSAEKAVPFNDPEDAWVVIRDEMSAWIEEESIIPPDEWEEYRQTLYEIMGSVEKIRDQASRELPYKEFVDRAQRFHETLLEQLRDFRGKEETPGRSASEDNTYIKLFHVGYWKATAAGLAPERQVVRDDFVNYLGRTGIDDVYGESDYVAVLDELFDGRKIVKRADFNKRLDAMIDHATTQANDVDDAVTLQGYKQLDLATYWRGVQKYFDEGGERASKQSVAEPSVVPRAPTPTFVPTRASGQRRPANAPVFVPYEDPQPKFEPVAEQPVVQTTPPSTDPKIEAQRAAAFQVGYIIDQFAERTGLDRMTVAGAYLHVAAAQVRQTAAGQPRRPYSYANLPADGNEKNATIEGVKLAEGKSEEGSGRRAMFVDPDWLTNNVETLTSAKAIQALEHWVTALAKSSPGHEL